MEHEEELSRAKNKTPPTETDLSSEPADPSPLLLLFKYFHHQQSDTWASEKTRLRIERHHFEFFSTIKHEKPFHPRETNITENRGCTLNTENKRPLMQNSPCAERTPFHDYMATSHIRGDTAGCGSRVRVLPPCLSTPYFSTPCGDYIIDYLEGAGTLRVTWELVKWWGKIGYVPPTTISVQKWPAQK